MNDSPTLDKLVVVNSRFARSVVLTRDAGRSDAIDGYILTPIGRDILRRLAAALRGGTSTRAWSVTGPYGSGKSSLALLAAQLLCGDDKVRQHARKYLSAADAGLAEMFFGPGGPLPKKAGRLFPVLVTGSRQPLDKALASALAASLRVVATRGSGLWLSTSLRNWPPSPSRQAACSWACLRRPSNTWGGAGKRLGCF